MYVSQHRQHLKLPVWWCMPQTSVGPVNCLVSACRQALYAQLTSRLVLATNLCIPPVHPHFFVSQPKNQPGDD